ncbi:MAG: hypothetical protein NDI82_02705 [Anaeromyxobacteraceae bacterium]|nr:hypothetical protein [Anaeromyxobacteraceae bacterium]
MSTVADPTLKPAAPPILTRSWLKGWWNARGAATSGVTLAEFLQFRASHYLRELAARGLRLPIEITLEGRELRLREVAPPRAPAAAPEEPTQRPGWELALGSQHGQGAVEALHDGRTKQEELPRLIQEAEADLKEAKRALAEAVTSGQATAVGEGEAAAHLRPHVPSSLWPRLALVGALAFTLAEAWQLAIPFMNFAGVDVTDLGAELRRAPLTVVLLALFALACTAALVWLAHGALRRFEAGIADGASPGARRRDLALAAAAGLLSFGLAFLLGQLRHGASEAGAALNAATTGATVDATSSLVFVLVTAIVPYFTAALWDWSRAQLTEREAALRAARAFDAALAAKRTRRQRLDELVRLAQQKLDSLRRERDGAVAVVQTLSWKGEEAQRAEAKTAARTEWAQGEALARAREELRAALEADRFAFLKAAGRAGGPHAGGGVHVISTPDGGVPQEVV